jgi:hypothetical protein
MLRAEATIIALNLDHRCPYTTIPRGHYPFPVIRLNSSSVNIMHLSFTAGTFSALPLLVVATSTPIVVCCCCRKYIRRTKVIEPVSDTLRSFVLQGSLPPSPSACNLRVQSSTETSNSETKPVESSGPFTRLVCPSLILTRASWRRPSTLMRTATVFLPPGPMEFTWNLPSRPPTITSEKDTSLSTQVSHASTYHPTRTLVRVKY